ncbi:MAG: UDP-N-acetylglucosamine 1-carboxyvinyltransferase [Phycisphaerae bacterium]|nr:UDP-N-acetylglucosamine 1-carboxyvinyltransferase [Phycisphaerae bacterium]
MHAFVIEGGRRLEGRLRINGSKNAALPILAASLLTDQPVTLRDVPDLADIRNMLGLLAELGCPHSKRDDGGLALRVTNHSSSHARYDVVRTMRASISVLGPLLARRGVARVSMPGGCAIGDRPVDLHLRGLAALGASISLDQGDIVARAPAGGLRGATVFMGGPFGSTVLGTANILCAATMARGETIIESAACEPEVVDLARMLTAMGARIEGAGSPRIVVRGVDQLGGVEHTVMPDRIEAGTLMCAAAITNGDVTLENCPIDTMIAAVDRLACAGVSVRPASPTEDRLRATVRVTAGRYLAPIEITTQPHPGFPTDLQAQMMALLTLAEGNSVVTEKIFPDRFLHVAEMARMGARMFRQGPTVVISGVRKLRGAPVMASDLRASASLVIAGLAAEGTTTVNRVYHLDRGYERFEERLNALGARVERVGDRTLAPNQPAGSEA